MNDDINRIELACSRIKELQASLGLPFKKGEIKLLKDEIIKTTNIKQIGKVILPNYALEWHPKVGSKGALMIFTTKSYEMAMDFRRSKARARALRG